MAHHSRESVRHQRPSKDHKAWRWRNANLSLPARVNDVAQSQAWCADQIRPPLDQLAKPHQCIALWVRDTRDGLCAKPKHRTGYFTDRDALPVAMDLDCVQERPALDQQNRHVGQTSAPLSPA
jgi:hypothetical protein